MQIATLELDIVEQLAGPRAQLLTAEAEVGAQRFGNALEDGRARIER